MTNIGLLNKYNVPVPRYTSYPTVPYWKENIEQNRWREVVTKRFSEINHSHGVSFYIHLPFCESLCTYCGCNKKITKNHSVEKEYIDAVIAEWQMYIAMLGEKPLVREIHLGGGTPTFFSPAHLSFLLESILSKAIIPNEINFSLEGHPNNTTREHLETLYSFGFRRVSYGVQDNDPIVQKVINRIQPFENVVNATQMAREIGYQSVNFDLIYGLPCQTLEGIKKTVEQCITLKPERVAFYSYAHVPWTSRGQRLFDEKDLPTPAQKMELYQAGRNLFTRHQYQDIGMDHFALPGDPLFQAWQDGVLHRNFMGYTTEFTGLIFGLGVSSISDSGNAFVQNAKSLHDYYAHLRENKLPLEKGYFLSEEDQVFRKYILDISCTGSTVFSSQFRDSLEEFSFPVLKALSEDGLLQFSENSVEVTSLGRSFIRNICSAFDVHLQKIKSCSSRPAFSKAI